MKYIKTEHLKALLKLATEKVERSDITQLERALNEQKLILDELKKRDINGFNY
jgi:hypothetical protein